MALLALPVGVAAAVGFSAGTSGLTEGLGSLASGPAEPPAPPADDSLDLAISTVAAPAGSGGSGGAGGAGADDVGTGGSGTGGVGGQGGGTVPSPVSGGSPPAGVDDVVPSPVVPDAGGAPDALPVPGGGTVDQVLDGIGDTVNGLLGGSAAD